MPISFKSKLRSSVANATFLDKTIDDTTVGKLGLNNAEPESLAPVLNLQKFINQLASTTGVSGEDDANRLVYSSNNYIDDGDNRKTAIGKLDQAIVDKGDEIYAYIDNGAFKIAPYPSDASYESNLGAPSGGEIYYNTTTGKVRYYDGIELEWKNVGSGGVAYQELIGTGNGTNTDFNITSAPTSPESILVFVDGLQVDIDDYSFSTPTITLNFAPAVGQTIYAFYLTEGDPAAPVVAAGTNNVIYRTITSGEVAAKQLTLSVAPSVATDVIADIIGGTSLHYGVDFSVAAAIFNWNSLGLDGVIAEGDIIRIQYFS